MMPPSPTYADIPYVTNGHERQKLDIYMPKSPSTSTSTSTSSTRSDPSLYPLIIYIHGGAFKFGSKRSNLIPYRLLDQGYAIASLDYRLSGDAPFPAAVQDCKSAVRFLRSIAATHSLDPRRFLAWGESAGAHCASMLGVTSIPTGQEGKDEFTVGEHLEVSSAVVGVVDYYGPTDFSRMDEQAPPDSVMSHDDAKSPESLYLGAKITEVPGVVARANPITYVEMLGGAVGRERGQERGGNEGQGESTKEPAFFIAHGAKDRVVAYGQSEIFVDALESYGWDVVFHPVQGVDHVFGGINSEQQRKLDDATDEFLRRVFS